MSIKHQIITIVIVVIATAITRFLPFILLSKNAKTPKYIQYLGETLPYAAIALLVVYCIKDVSIITYPFALPECISILFIVFVHLKKGNMFISIGGGSLLYLFLLQCL